MIVLDQMPIPPSVNAKRFNAKQRRFYTTKEQAGFLKQIEIWENKFKDHIKVMRETLEPIKNKPLKLEIQLLLTHESLFTKKGTPRKMDADNRLKPLVDKVAAALQIDDKMFFKISIEKLKTKSRQEFARAWVSEI